MTPTLRVFISANSRDFASCREKLSDLLRKKFLEVRVQEDFVTGPHTLLMKLEHYIDLCDAVIVLVGPTYGEEPPLVRARCSRRSYTQWEYHFALEKGKPTYVFLLEGTSALDHPLSVSCDPAGLQAAFRNDVIHSGKDWKVFRTREELFEQVLTLELSAGAHIFGPSREDRVAFEEAFLRVMAECRTEGVPFLTMTKYPPFWARTQEMQVARDERNRHRLLGTGGVLERVLRRYPLWETIVAENCAFVIVEKSGVEHYFRFASNDFREVLLSHIETLQSVIAMHDRLFVGVSEEEIPETFFCGASTAALTYHNRLPASVEAPTVIRGTFHYGINQGEPFRRVFSAAWQKLPERWKDKHNIANWLHSLTTSKE